MASLKPRIMGIENEYGLVFYPKGKVYLPIEKILGYIFEGLIPSSWPSNAFLPNGARFYQDTGCHPEYATPECDNLLELVAHDKAGERILESSLPIADKRLREEGILGEIRIFKNNTDSLGNTYGCHENYLTTRAIDFWKLAEQLTPFLVTRQIFTGAGKVLKVGGKSHYVISQRAQHIHEKSSSSTTSSRSIINTRDEPHADAEKYRRLHVIIGDSNMSEYTTFLKVGTAALILAMVEAGHHVTGLEMEDPIKALRDISRDLTLKKRVRLISGKEMNAIDIQRVYLEKAREYLTSEGNPDEEVALLNQWEEILTRLEEDMPSLARKIDWVIKHEMIRSYMDKNGCEWDDPKIALIDLQYHDVDQNKGLYYLLCREGLVDRVTTEEAIQGAMVSPPQTTRAKVRGDFIKFAQGKNRSYTVDWTYLKLNGYWEETILCMDPFASTHPRLEEILLAATMVHK